MRFDNPLSPQAADDLDDLFRAFFRSQLPKTWPTPRLPLSSATLAERHSPSGRSLPRSRWALAASIGVLLLGSLFLPSRLTQNVKTEQGINGPGISDRKILPHERKGHKGNAVEPGHKVGMAGDNDPFHEFEDADFK